MDAETLRLARQVQEVRDLQKRYFRERDPAVCRDAKAKEKALDKAIAEILDDRPSLFAEESER